MPTHAAAPRQHDDADASLDAAVAAQLLKAGCAVDAVDADGNSALHHAGRGAQEWLFDLLEMRHGADSELRNAKGEVPTVSAEPCRIQ